VTKDAAHQGSQLQKAAPLKNQPSTVVGVGASAGGLEALKKFFKSAPSGAGIAYVVIQHLPPEDSVSLVSLLRDQTRLPVTEISPGLQLAADTVYVLPAGKYVEVHEGRLSLHEPIEPRGARMPIDCFFRSLSQDQRENAVGIILSGAGQDGTKGIREIKERGGMVMVQEPDEAGFDDMPKSALQSDVADYILPAEQLQQALINYVEHNELFDDRTQDIGNEASQIAEIVHLLEANTDYDFRQYKHSTLTRRIRRRVTLRNLSSIDEYIHLLRDKPEELDALGRDLLICVTSFFRNPEAWEELRTEVLEKIAGEKQQSSEPIRVWVPGCATGEEAYSLAMMLSEAVDGRRERVQLFATDISNNALKVARAGLYPEVISADVSPERLRRFFVRDGDGYRVIKPLREMVVFASQDIKGDPPFSRVDLVSCRNLLIYLTPEAQKNILAKIHFALRRGGYLFLGNSETPSRGTAPFDPISTKWRIYRRADGVALPEIGAGRTRRLSIYASEPGTRKRQAAGYQELLAEMKLRHSAGATLFVNARWQPVFIAGVAKQFFEVPAGEQRQSILDMARHGLHLKLRTALQRAAKEGVRSSFDRARVKQDAGPAVLVSGSVIPIKHPETDDPLFLVELLGVPEPETAAAIAPAEENREEISRQLEHELHETKEQLSSTIEELEQANEALKAANEEAISVNEELQSGNEELEASKKELQSLNEELTVVNSRLEEKVRELEGANTDFDNLLSSAKLAVIFLDTSFRIRNFTPQAADLFRVIRSDVGRPIGDLTHNFTRGDLLADARHVLKTLATVEREVQTQDGRWFLREMLPYRTRDNRIEGVVVTFHDVSRLKQIQYELEQQKDQLRLVTDSLPVLIAYIDRDERYQFLNAAFEEWHHRPIADSLGRRMSEVVSRTVYNLIRPDMERALAGETVLYERELEYPSGPRFVQVQYIPQRGDDGGVLGFYALIQDISQRKRNEAALKESESRFRVMADCAPVLIWRSGPDKACNWVNQGWLDFTGRALDQVLGDGWTAGVHPDDLPRYLRDYEAAFDARRPFEVEFRLRRADGNYRYLLERGVPLIDESDAFLGYIGSCIDITERTEFERELDQARREADSASRSKSEFVANMSHEIRTPMTAILGYADVLAAHLLDEDDLHCVETIRRNGRFLLEIINDILDLSKIEAGRLDMNFERIRVDSLVNDILAMMRLRAVEKGLILDARFVGLLPETIESDPRRLRQILINLIGNGIKFTDHGSVRLSITFDADRSQIVFEVADTGIGISEDLQARLFRPFTQADASVTRHYEGTGLGLAITRRLAEMLGGEISVTSAIHQGSTFRVTVGTGSLDSIPLVEPELVEEASTPAPGVPHLPGCRVLVVDDRSEIRFLAKQFIEKSGAAVELAVDGNDALLAIDRAEHREEPFDVVLLDMQMPVKDGYTTARELRAQGFRQPIIAVTAHAMQGDRERCLEVGCNDYTPKPLEPRRLLELVARYCRKPGKTGSSRAVEAHMSETTPNRTAGSGPGKLRDQPPVAGRPAASPAAMVPAKARRVLLVDDNGDACLAQSMLLKMRGYEVETATSGRDALVVYERFKPDIVLMDLGMPEMSGFDVVRQLRGKPGSDQSLFIALSGRGEAEDRAKAREAGFHRYAVKPIDLVELEQLFETSGAPEKN
jgi:two-component system, chemotaxis family, CheB/CheR fusion protein